MTEVRTEDRAAPGIEKLGASVSDKRWSTAQKHERRYWLDVKNNGYRGLPPEQFAVWHAAVQAWNLHYLEHDFDWYNDKTVVEIGCGPLGVVAGLEARHKIGVDPLLPVYQGLWDLDAHGCTYLPEQAEAVSLEDNVADVLICLNVLDHVQAPSQVLKEMRRIVKEDGELFLSLSLEDQDEQCHPHGFSLAGITGLLQDSGFRIVKAQVAAEYQSPHRPFHFSSVCQPTSYPHDHPSPDDSANAGTGQATMHVQQLETKIAAYEAENLELRDLVRRYESGRLLRLTAKVANVSCGWRDRFSYLQDRISDLQDWVNQDLLKRGP